MAEQEHLCPPDQHWVTSHPRRAYTKTDGTFFSATHVNSSCHPNPVGYSKWKDRFLNSKPSYWPRTGEKQKKWTVEERERVLEALADLPEPLLLDSVKEIYRFEKSQDYDKNPASGESGALGVYDAAFNKNANLTRVLAHELAHELFRQFSVADKILCAKAMGWTFKKDEKTEQYRAIPRKSGYVEVDGQLLTTEDFANNIEYFLFNQKRLNEVTPQAAEWIRHKFGDKLKLRKGTQQ